MVRRFVSEVLQATEGSVLTDDEWNTLCRCEDRTATDQQAIANIVLRAHALGGPLEEDDDTGPGDRPPSPPLVVPDGVSRAGASLSSEWLPVSAPGPWGLPIPAGFASATVEGRTPLPLPRPELGSPPSMVGPVRWDQPADAVLESPPGPVNFHRGAPAIRILPGSCSRPRAGGEDGMAARRRPRTSDGLQLDEECPPALRGALRVGGTGCWWRPHGSATSGSSSCSLSPGSSGEQPSPSRMPRMRSGANSTPDRITPSPRPSRAPASCRQPSGTRIRRRGR